MNNEALAILALGLGIAGGVLSFISKQWATFLASLAVSVLAWALTGLG